MIHLENHLKNGPILIKALTIFSGVFLTTNHGLLAKCSRRPNERIQTLKFQNGPTF